jgi:hypothetical protein
MCVFKSLNGYIDYGGYKNQNAHFLIMPQMHKYGESKMTQIMMATVHHVTSSLGLRKIQAA